MLHAARYMPHARRLFAAHDLPPMPSRRVRPPSAAFRDGDGFMLLMLFSPIFAIRRIAAAAFRFHLFCAAARLSSTRRIRISPHAMPPELAQQHYAAAAVFITRPMPTMFHILIVSFTFAFARLRHAA